MTNIQSWSSVTEIRNKRPQNNEDKLCIHLLTHAAVTEIQNRRCPREVHSPAMERQGTVRYGKRHDREGMPGEHAGEASKRAWPSATTIACTESWRHLGVNQQIQRERCSCPKKQRPPWLEKNENVACSGHSLTEGAEGREASDKANNACAGNCWVKIVRI